MIKIIVAMDDNNGIGYKGKMPWHIPEDLKFFKETTLDHAIIMGRKTRESIGDRPLPNRLNLVISRARTYNPKDSLVFQSPQNALDYATDIVEDVFIIGGATIYEQFLPVADELIISKVKGSYKVDTFFPYFDESLYNKELIQKFDRFDVWKYQLIEAGE